MRRLKRLLICFLAVCSICCTGLSIGFAMADNTQTETVVATSTLNGVNVNYTADGVYSSITTAEIKNVDLTNKYIAIRIKDNSVASKNTFILEPKFIVDGTQLSREWNKLTYYVSYRGVTSANTDWGTTFGFNHLNRNFDGWVVYETGAYYGADLTGNLKVSWSMHSDWSRDVNIDLGEIVIFDAPQTTTYQDFKSAIDAGSVVYRYGANNYTLADMDASCVTTVTKGPRYKEAEFNGVNLRVDQAISASGYQKIVANYQADYTNKLLAVRMKWNYGGGTDGLDFKVFDVNGTAMGSVPMYFLDNPNKGYVAGQFYWNVLPNEGFNGWVIVSVKDSSLDLSAGAKSLSLGIMGSSATFSADFGSIVVFDAPTGEYNFNSMTAAINAGTVVYEYATADAINEKNFYEFGTEDITVAHVKAPVKPDDPEEPAGPAVVDGDFNGIQVNVNKTLSDVTYGYQKFVANYQADYTGKLLALRIKWHRGGGTNGLDFKVLDANGTAMGSVPMYFLDNPNKGYVPGQFYWNLLPNEGFNGWVIVSVKDSSLDLSAGAKSLSLGIMGSSATFSADFGSIVVFDAPTGEYNFNSMTAAINAGTVVYEYATADAINENNVYDFGFEDITVAHVKAPVQPEQPTVYPEVDGFFEGAQFAIETLTDYRYFWTAEIDFSMFAGKYLAIQIADRSWESNYSIDLKIGDKNISGAKMYYVNVGRDRIAEEWSNWDVRLDRAFYGYVVIDVSDIQLPASGCIQFGFHSDFSIVCTIDLGLIKAINLPANMDVAGFTSAFEAGTTVYNFAKEEASVNEDVQLFFGNDKVVVSRTHATLGVTNLPAEEYPEVDGFFEGMQLKVNRTEGYTTIKTSEVQTSLFNGKLVAIQIADRAWEYDYSIDFQFGNVIISGAQIYYVNVGRNRVTTAISDWDLAIEYAYYGYIVIDPSKLVLPETACFTFGFHVDFSKVPALDFGAIKLIDLPANMDVAGFTAAFEAGTMLYNFAHETSNASINPELSNGFTVQNAIISRTHATLDASVIPAEKLPAHCEVVGDTKVLGFANVNSSNITSHIHNAPDFPNCIYSVINRESDGTASSKKAIRVKIGASTERDQTAAIEPELSGYLNKIDEDAKGMTVWVKNYQSVGMHINLGFDMGIRWEVGRNNRYISYQLFNTVTGEERVYSGHFEGIYLPANFEGYVRVAFSQFAPANWVVAPIDWDEARAIGSVSYMVVGLNSDLYVGYEIALDNIGWYYGEATTERLFLDFGDDTPTIKEIMKSDFFGLGEIVKPDDSTEEYIDLNGKKVSILSDSNSTYAGVSNNTNANSTIGNNYIFFPAYQINDIGETWWAQVIENTNCELLVNNSSSGAKASGDAIDNGWQDRCVQLHGDKTEEAVNPDIIFIRLGGNDFNGGVECGTFTQLSEIWTEESGYITPTNYAQALAIILHKATTKYQDADVFVFNLLYRNVDATKLAAYNEQIAYIAEYFGCTLVDWASVTEFDPAVHTSDGIHYNESGMKLVAKCVIDTLTEFYGNETEVE